VQFTVRFYVDSHGGRPVLLFLEELRHTDLTLHKLVIVGIKKIEQSERHGPPLTEMIDPSEGILELRIGIANIARVFFFFRRGQEIILTNGYVKKKQKVDAGALAKARAYKRDWEERFP
jgi:phage-related protein